VAPMHIVGGQLSGMSVFSLKRSVKIANSPLLAKSLVWPSLSTALRMALPTITSSLFTSPLRSTPAQYKARPVESEADVVDR
jgi:hypothetical protein